MVLPASHGISRVPWYSGAHGARYGFAYAAFTLCGRAFQRCSAAISRSHYVSPQPRPSEDFRFGLFPVRSPLLGKSLLLSFPPPT